jgi:glycine oxidase
LEVDYIIAGQGIAGTLLAYFLEKAGQRIFVIDPVLHNSATQVAAGIINPITGRRFVKSWKVDSLIPFAKQTYQAIEQEFNISCFHEQAIIRTLFNVREEQDWLIRTDEEGYSNYMAEEAKLGLYKNHTVPAYAYGEVKHSAQVDIGKIAQAYRERLLEKGLFLKDFFKYDELIHRASGVSYQQIQAKGIIFCEGAKAKDNPFFKHLPFGGTKGEVLIVNIPDANFSRILKHRVFIVPFSSGQYWIGATYDWKFDTEQPTPEGRDFLEGRLSEVLKVPYEVMAHQAAVRPTVKDRRPFLGQHHTYDNLYIFNGMGTKGASLAPFWAQQMTQFLLNNRILDKMVDISRFV